METTLIFVETVFYFTASAAVITIGVSCVIVTHHLIRIAKELEGLSRNLNNASSEMGEQISSIIDRFSNLPMISYFLKKHSATHSGKGRGKSSKK